MLQNIREAVGTRGAFLLIVCMLGFAPCAHAAETTAAGEAQELEEIGQAVPTENDEQLTEQVRAALKEISSLHASLADIQLKTVNGVVHLKGTVASEDEKKAIEERARTCPGVTQIRSHIRVAG